MSDIFWQALFAAFATVVISWMQMRTKLAVDSAKRATVKAATTAAEKVAEVKYDLSATASGVVSQLSRLEKMGETNHALLNGGMEIQLQIAATALRRIADMSQQGPDEKAAVFAEQRLAEHQAKLAAMIAGSKAAAV